GMPGMPLPAQPWPVAAAWFLAMWLVMMVAMMLPSLAPVLWRYRRTGGLARLIPLVGAGYFAIWTAVGMAVLPLRFAVAAIAELPALVRAVPIGVSLVALLAGLLQFTAWKAHHLGCCRAAPAGGGTLRADARTAWREGVRLGL